MPRFRKRPEEVEAEQWTGKLKDLSPSFIQEVSNIRSGFRAVVDGYVAEPGDWIIRDGHGVVKVVKPILFGITYEAVDA